VERRCFSRRTSASVRFAAISARPFQLINDSLRRRGNRR
jgi:hypothetical protein